MKLAVWSPLPPSPSGIADYASEQIGPLQEHFEIVSVPSEPATRPEADLDLYHLGNSPAHAFVYRAALERAGVAVLHDWSLHHLVLSWTVERGDSSRYLREMRRAYGELGTFVGRQVARALGGDLLPALYPLNERILEGSLAVVGLSEWLASLARLRLAGRPVLHLPHHLFLPSEVKTKEEARRALGLEKDSFLVTAPGLATASKGLLSALGATVRLARDHEDVRLVVAGAVEGRLPFEGWIQDAGAEGKVLVTGRLGFEDFVSHLAAADVILSLRFPSHGEMSGALVRALGVGRPALDTAGTPAALEFPEGVVIRVDPGPLEEREIASFLSRLREDAPLREAIGARAREYVGEKHALVPTTSRLAAFLREVYARRGELEASLTPPRALEGSLPAYLLDEVRWAALDLGLSGVSLGHEERLLELVPKAP